MMIWAQVLCTFCAKMKQVLFLNYSNVVSSQCTFISVFCYLCPNLFFFLLVCCWHVIKNVMGCFVLFN